jgi:phenylpropionate dioxygenase-like ring-hydroxylating dioxygenase large terminal subunit
MFVRDAWYVAGWSYEFPQDELITRTLLNEPLVFYRKRDGVVVALQDRCVHRAAPLSLGCREGDDLRCMYHGLKFAASGKCIEVPGHEGPVPDRARVRSFPLVERHSWVWLWPGDPARADPSLIPPAIGLDHPDWTLKPGQLDYAASYQLVHDNLLDFSHVAYVHRNSFLADEQWARKQPKVTALERGVRVERWIENMVGLSSVGTVDNWCYYDFLVPGILLLGGKIFPAGTAATCNGRAPAMAPLRETFSCQAVTPITATTSRYFFSWGPRSGEGAQAIAAVLIEVAHKAFAEDKAIIEAQQLAASHSSVVPGMAIPSDGAVLLFQRLMKRLAQFEAGCGTPAAAGVRT